MNKTTDIAKKDQVAAVEHKQIPVVAPVVDIYENEEDILLYAEMPGIDKEALNINIDNGTLKISGVRKVGNSANIKREEFGDVEYLRTFSVPQTIEVEKINAELKEGVLRLHLPKSEAAKPRQIEIKEG